MPVRIRCHLRDPAPQALSRALESTLGSRDSDFEVVISHSVDEDHVEVLIFEGGQRRSAFFANVNDPTDVLAEGLRRALTQPERR
jgi:hypothetical protein